MDAWFHIFQESISLVLGFLILKEVSPLARLHSKDIPELYWLQTWAIFSIIFTAIHVSIATFGILSGISMAAIIPLTYLPERVSDSLFAFFCAKPPKQDHKSVMRISTAMILLFIGLGVYAITFTTNAHSLGAIGRPQELLQVLPAAIAFGALLDVQKKFGKFLKWSTLATLIGGMVMLASHRIFDLPFEIAHWFKVLSYLIIFINVKILMRDIRKEPHDA